MTFRCNSTNMADIQLVTASNDKKIFNDNADITFFKIRYRRHNNFYLENNKVISNNVKLNNVIDYKVPFDGDYLSKSYIEFDMDENYVELFDNYANLNITLNTNILNYYDSFNIRINNYSKNVINDIEIAKFNVFINNVKIISIMTTIATNDLLPYIKNDNTIFLETNEYYYNINEQYKFYSFNLYKSTENNQILK